MIGFGADDEAPVSVPRVLIPTSDGHLVRDVTLHTDPVDGQVRTAFGSDRVLEARLVRGELQSG
jgi:hypothetical protein